MAKIDVSKIEGFADMTAEQKLAALEAYEYEDNAKALADMTADRDRYKASNSTALSKVSELTKAQKELLSEDERKAQEQAEKLSTMEAELATLRKDKAIATTKSSYMGLGYSEELASEIAKHSVDGNIEAVIATQQKFLVAYKKELEKGLVNAVPAPAPGSVGGRMTKDAFRKLSPQERADFSQKKPEEYRAMYESP